MPAIALITLFPAILMLIASGHQELSRDKR